MTKIIFMGTPAFAATVLEGIVADGKYEVLAVVTQPDRAVGRKRNIQMTPVKEIALRYQIPIYQPEKLTGSQELAELLTLGADGIITAAFGQFLPTTLLNSVDFAVNVHASLLPKYRGGAPIHYALMNGDERAGVTIMEMVKEMDAGDMIASDSVIIEESDNVGTLFEKLAIIGRDLLLRTLPTYLSGEIQAIPQDISQVTFAPNIQPDEERLDWTKTARQLFNQIRGMYPWPIAHTIWKKERFKIYEAIEYEASGLPGQVLVRTKKELVIGTGQGALALKVVQPAGKPKMPIADFLNGAGRELVVGDTFGE